MPFTEKDTKVARAVVDWLNSVAERAGAEEAESLLAASQCVQSVCGALLSFPSPFSPFSQLHAHTHGMCMENRRLG